MRTRPSRATARRGLLAAGTCHACGVLFLTPPGADAVTREVLRIHEAICPGGRRAGEIAVPAKHVPREKTSSERSM